MSNEVLTVSSKGQVVLPSAVRKQLSITTGSKLATFVIEDMIVLKRIDMPTIDQFKAHLAEARAWASEVGYKETDVKDIIKSVRQNKHK